MNKFSVIAKREYKRLVLTKTFLFATFFTPLFGLAISFAPLFFSTYKSEAVRLAVVDRTGEIAAELRRQLRSNDLDDDQETLTETTQNGEKIGGEDKISSRIKNDFVIETVSVTDEDSARVRRELTNRILSDSLDIYLYIPPNIIDGKAKIEIYGRNTSDVLTRTRIERATNRIVRDLRLSRSNIDRSQMEQINRSVDFELTKVSENGEEEDDGSSSLVFVFILGFMTYLLLILNGQQIINAVIEEKETRIAEILFSSATPFELMLGKLFGVGFAGLTQFGIWLFSLVLFGIYGAASASSVGFSLRFPNVSPFVFVGLLVFFLIGYFIYGTIYTIIASITTTIQEAGQLLFIPMIFLMTTFYSAFLVVREPNSIISQVLSLFPFSAPIAMPVRMILQTPPIWQILLSVLFSLVSIVCLVWLAGKIYRVGMLMYGKRATLPEIWHWIKLS